MPIPILPIVLAVGAAAGTAASKGIAAVRRRFNRGETTRARCRCCGDEGPHPFSTIDRSWAGSLVVGMLTGAIGGTVAGTFAKRVFSCGKCGAAMYANGERPGWNADQAIDAFVRYPKLKAACEELQVLLARDQELARKHAEQIKALEVDLESAASDKLELERRVRAMIALLKREHRAA